MGEKSEKVEEKSLDQQPFYLLTLLPFLCALCGELNRRNSCSA
jgi:hypothetical protein